MTNTEYAPCNIPLCLKVWK